MLDKKNTIIKEKQDSIDSLKIKIENLKEIQKTQEANKEANKELILKYKNELDKIKETNAKKDEEITKINSEINTLKGTITEKNKELKKLREKEAADGIMISKLTADSLKDKKTIDMLRSELEASRGKISPSECVKKGYTKTSDITKNVHFFDGKKYIREDSIVSDKIKLNRKDYVKLINGKCLNQYSRPCPKPKIIFKKSTRSATVSDIKKYNFLYRRYRCAVINNTRNKRVAYRKWIQQRNLIRAKTRKYPRYPPFNSRMCGRSRGRIISRNRCVGICAKYKSLIIDYRQRITRLKRAYNINMNRLAVAQKSYRRYSGAQRGTPAFVYRTLYRRYYAQWRKTSRWRPRKKRYYYARYRTYFNLFNRQKRAGIPLLRAIRGYRYSSNVQKNSINRYQNLITNYKKAYPRQLR